MTHPSITNLSRFIVLECITSIQNLLCLGGIWEREALKNITRDKESTPLGIKLLGGALRCHCLANRQAGDFLLLLALPCSCCV